MELADATPIMKCGDEMAALFSRSDIPGWVAQHEKKMSLLQRRLGTQWQHSEDEQGLGLLSLTMRQHGYIQIALENRKEAIASFAQAVRIRASLVDSLCAGHFQDLLIALAVDDGELTKMFAELLPTDLDSDPEDSAYIAKGLKALTLGQVEAARNQLSEPAPDVDAQFTGFVECLRSIANENWADFEIELRGATKAWERFTRREFEGNPCSSCFIEGVGFLKLASRLGGQQRDVAIEHIPPWLFS